MIKLANNDLEASRFILNFKLQTKIYKKNVQNSNGLVNVPWTDSLTSMALKTGDLMDRLKKKDVKMGSFQSHTNSKKQGHI